MSRIISFVYGVISYMIFLVVFIYAIGFVGNIVVPKSIDIGPEASIPNALLINVIFLVGFAIQHSVMARQGFKELWIKIVPESVERSTYVLISSLWLALLYWHWHPMPRIIWQVENSLGYAVLMGLFWIGWMLVVLATFMIDHFDLFGLRQVYLFLRGREYTPLDFKTPGLYKYIRHPIILGFTIAFWATPQMTVGHLLFAIATIAYMLIAIQFEERDLVKRYGDKYENYRRFVPMLIPIPKRRD